jgi:Flavin containing amine oxidoreductase
LSAAGTTQYRLHPDQSGFTNLILAGEGTRHGFNTTTFEGAVMSGAAASRAICGEPTRIVGYDFLQRRFSQGPGA